MKAKRARYQHALMQAVRDELAADERVVYLGEDVVHSLRGVSAGLADEFGPDRVIDTPISEQAFTSFATGAALGGFRPIVEYQIPSLLYTAFEQIVNQAQKFSMMTGGQGRVSVTYLVPGSGARRGLAAQHSDHQWAMFAQAGVKCVVPATASDAYGLFRSAVQDEDPVVYFAPAAALPMREETIEPFPEVPLGTARLHRSGSDVTLVAIGHLVALALDVADQIADEISVEVFDPRTIYPFDWDGLRESVRRTGRIVVCDDGNRSCGLAAEILATVSERLAPGAAVARVTRADSPVPFALALEEAVLPARQDLIEAIRHVCNSG